MKYYVVADVHGFYTEMRKALDEKGFFCDDRPYKLIVCGDLFDRGSEALQMQDFILDLIKKDEVILIRGNHEDLIMNLIDDWEDFGYMQSHHRLNGTIDTVLQLAQSPDIMYINAREVKRKLVNTPYVKTIIPNTIDYFETEHYIFVHGWIPCAAYGYSGQESVFIYEKDWRSASAQEWSRARWYNGMAAARQGVTEPGKTIVCGHRCAVYGHARIEGACSENGADADFSPYFAKGIIAIDAGTARFKKVNCIVLED